MNNTTFYSHYLFFFFMDGNIALEKLSKEGRVTRKKAQGSMNAGG